MRREGCWEEKKFCEFEQRLVQNKKYTELLMGENQSPQARFFPAKRLSYFLVNIRHHSKAQTFFSMDRFPASRFKSFFFDKSFSHKEIYFFFQIVPRPFKSANYAIDGFWRNHGSLTRYFSLTRESKEVWETLFNSIHVLNLLASPLVQIWKKKKKKSFSDMFPRFLFREVIADR